VPPTAPAILFYDRDCRFCAWGVVGLVRRSRPGTLRLAPIQGPLGDRRLGHLPEQRRLESWHVWDGERLRSEADVLDVVGPLVRAPALRVALTAARLLPRPLASAAYRLMAARRVAISRRLPDRWKRAAEARLPGLLADADRATDGGGGWPASPGHG
jgi:predicted DCC family thiol-disulfide oxidoreductase YuxK